MGDMDEVESHGRRSRGHHSSLLAFEQRGDGIMAVNLKGLIGKLNEPTRNALEAAAGFCLARTHYDIEIEHYLSKLLETTDGDVPRIFKHFGVNSSRLASDLTRTLDKLKSGNART